MDSPVTRGGRPDRGIPRRPARRDRHGRGFRRDLIPSHLPGYRTRREIFDDTVLDSFRPLLERFERGLEHVQVTVEEVPSSDPRPWEGTMVPLGRFVPADRHQPPRIVLYRRPIETRCAQRGEIELMIRQVLAEQVAAHLSIPPEDVDPEAWSG